MVASVLIVGEVDGVNMCINHKTRKSVDFDVVGNCEYAIFSSHMKV